MPASAAAPFVIDPLDDPAPEDDAPEDAPPPDEAPPTAPAFPTFPVHAATSAYTRAPPRNHEALGIAREGRRRGVRILTALRRWVGAGGDRDHTLATLRTIRVTLPAMSAFTPGEIAYLQSQRLGRIATAADGGADRRPGERPGVLRRRDGALRPALARGVIAFARNARSTATSE